MTSSTAEDIWSTRLQRELLALTTEDEGSKKNIGVLPPFVTVTEHHLNIAKGVCKVSFGISVEDVMAVQKNEDAAAITATDDTATANATAAAAVKEDGDENVKGEGEKKDSDDEVKKDDQTKLDDTTEETNSTTTTTTQNIVIVTIDASLKYKYGSQVPDASTSYPFFKPKAYLTSGAKLLPPSIDVQDGTMIQIDCDWTPSLHLNDAALNIALKVRESVRRGEACLRVETLSSNAGIFGEENAFDAKVSNFFTSLKSKASALVEEVDSKLDVAMREKPRKRREQQQQQQQATPAKVVTEDNVENGDLIDLSQGPWNQAVGMYPCRAIRRPAFIETAIKAANNKTRKVAGSGFAGAGSMFKSFSKSAKSLVEESFLLLTNNLLLEISCSKFSVSTATVTFCIPISHLSKLKFRREESISLFFKTAPDDPIIYMCESSADAVKQIQSVLKQHGVKGKHTNATMVKTVQIAVEMLADIKKKEEELANDPRPERVTEIMDLYRQAAEKFEMAEDKRHEDVMSSMREFLANPHVSGVLDGSIKPQEAVGSKSVEPNPINNLDTSLDTSMDLEEKSKEEAKDEELDKAMKAAEEMLNDAHDELKDLGVTDDMEELEKDVLKTADDAESSSKDVVSEFEDMLADADKELEELMGT